MVLVSIDFVAGDVIWWNTGADRCHSITNVICTVMFTAAGWATAQRWKSTHETV